MPTPPYTGLHASPSPPRTVSKQHDPAPIASTSRLPYNAELQGKKPNQPTAIEGSCWCGTAPRGLRAKGATAIAIALLAPAAVAASPVSPLSSKQTGKLRAIESDSPALPRPTTPPRAPPSFADPSDPPSPALLIAQEAVSPRRRKRAAVLPKYEYVDGSWIINPTATLRGRTAGGGGDAALAGDDSATARATALQDNLDELTTSSTKTSASTRRTTGTSSHLSSSTASLPTPSPTHSANAPHGTPKIAAAASATSEFTIPDGWAATPRETNFYAFPVIVAMSVLVAITVVGTVVGSVVWRRKRRVKRNKEGEAEKGRMGRMMEKVGLGAIAPKKKSKKKGGKSKGKKGGAGKGSGGGGAGAAAEGPAAGLDRVDSRASSDLGSGSAGGRRAITRANASALPPAGRLRPRRRRQPRVEDEEQEEEERSALTGSQPDRPATPHDTLTSRLQARLRNPIQGAPPSPTTQRGPATVFSRDLDRTSTHSTYSSGGRLSRTSSLAASLRSHEDPSRLLGQPQDIEDRPTLSRSSSQRSLAPSTRAPASPALSAHSNASAFGSTVLDVPLPALGPPAYRPASSTVQSTTRMSISRVPVPRIEVEEESAPSTSSEPTASGGVERDEHGQLWHWPNEKPARQVAPAPRRRSRRVPALAPPPPAEEEEEDHPPVDRSLYSAHLATDDKAVLARIREQASTPLAHGGQQASSSSSRPEQLPEASAPAVEGEEDDLVDEDGFERLPLPSGGAGPSQRTPSHPLPSAPPAPTAPTSSLLPAPPRPVDLAFDYTTTSPSLALSSDHKTSTGPSGSSRRRAPVEDEQEAEEAFLPVYQTRERSRVMEMASAPPPEEEEDVDEEEQRWAEEDRQRWEGREEEGEV